MKYSDADRILALAALFQAAALTKLLAHDGKAPEVPFDASVYSLLQLDAPDVPSVFQGTVGVQLGLRTLLTQLTSAAERNLEMTRYVVALLQLEAKLSRDPSRLTQLGADLANLRQRREAGDLGDNALWSGFGELYQRHISTLSPRIMVKGEPLYLQNPDLAAKIRTSLFAGVRAARLWRQCGGRRWQLLFHRRRILSAARRLLDHSTREDRVV